MLTRCKNKLPSFTQASLCVVYNFLLSSSCIAWPSQHHHCV